jgi:hypothetical protein
MHDIDDVFVDEWQKAWCVHCGEWITTLETSRDRVPSRSLLQKPYPANLPVMQVCKSCNAGFAMDEEYLLAFLGAVLTGLTEPDRQLNPKTRRILKRSEKLRNRIERAKDEIQTLFGEIEIFWRPEWERIEHIIVKNARGQAFFGHRLVTIRSVAPSVLGAVAPIKVQTDFDFAGQSPSM